MPSRLNHTMFRIVDAKRSLDFYTKIIGMELIHEMDGGDFTNYFLAFPEEGRESQTQEEKSARKFQREGVLELCHNHEHAADFPGYCNGNTDPGRGFGHICVTVDDLDKECARLEAAGVAFKKKRTEGKMKNIAFALDPDGYWIELVGNGTQV